MPSIARRDIHALKALANRYDLESIAQKRSLLAMMSKKNIPAVSHLVTYVNTLLFVCAFPDSRRTQALAESELKRVSAILKSAGGKIGEYLVNSGLPFTEYLASFSHTFVSKLMHNSSCRVDLSSIEDTAFSLNDIVYLTLPSVEKNIYSAGHADSDLMDALLVDKRRRLTFILNELSRYKDTPLVQDFLYDGLEVYVTLKPRNQKFSRVYNRLRTESVFFHNGIIKKFDHIELFNRPVAADKIHAAQKKELIDVIHTAMAVTARETDTVTYMDERSLRYYSLERGLSVAIYGIAAERQLPLESYVGYTLFKNGIPAAYGGAWIFGRRSEFGIHIFEAFRGGESGFMMCQLLRVYRQVFHIDYFLVEAFQYGLDNPEGIESAAFWFYYRYGFRPIDKAVNKIAADEFEKICASKKYHSKKSTLVKFTESNIALNLGDNVPVSVGEVTGKIRRMIQRKYRGDRQLAERESVTRFVLDARIPPKVKAREVRVLQEVALWANAFGITDDERLQVLTDMIHVKPVDPYAYQDLLLRFFRRK